MSAPVVRGVANAEFDGPVKRENLASDEFVFARAETNESDRRRTIRPLIDHRRGE
jgi:hypothetical protein